MASSDDKLNVTLDIQVTSNSHSTTVNKPLTWRDRIQKYSWQWHVIVMATGICSSLLHNFPYHTGDIVLDLIALSLSLVNLVIFLILCAWMIARCVMFPEDWTKLFTDPSKNLFMGFFVNGFASLISAALSVNHDWGVGGTPCLYGLWTLWWLDCCLSCVVSFGMVYIMMGQNSRDMDKVGTIWMLPSITMITISASGGAFTRSLLLRSHTLALISVSVSSIMLLIGLSFTMMFTAAFLLRLYLYGPMEARIVLTTFSVLTPLGQGGYSLLLNGQDLSALLPDAMLSDALANPLIGKTLFSICFCGAFALWSMGLAWILVACFSIVRRGTTLPPFCISHWCVIVPNGTFAALSVCMASVLDSAFFRVFGTVWSCLVFLLWTAIFLRSIPALVDGSIFPPPPTTTSNDHTKPEPGQFVMPRADEETCMSSPEMLEKVQERNESSLSVDTLCETLQPAEGR